MVLLTVEVILLENIFTHFLITESLIYGYMLIVSADAIITSSLTAIIYYISCLKSKAWTMTNLEYFKFDLSRDFLIPKYSIFEKSAVKLSAGMTNLVGNSTISFIIFMIFD